MVLLADVYLSLDGTVIQNHGYVEIGDIGSISDNEALLCHTNRPPPPNSTTSGGEWYAPNGDRVGGTPAVPGFARNRGPMVVRLGDSSGTPSEGIYQCSLEDNTSTVIHLHVGLYNSGQGCIECFEI